MTAPNIPGVGQLWGSKSTRLRDKAPRIHETIRGYGRPFIVRRPRVPDVEIIAFMWEGKPAGRVDAAAPGFTVLPSEVIFLPDAPVMSRHFLLIDPETGRVYTPDNDVQDVAHQHVFLWGRVSPYLEHTRADVLSFRVATAEVTQDPRSGNSVPVYRNEPVTVRLSATQDPQTREMVGIADPAAVVFVGRWGSLLEPMGRPAQIDWGDSAALYVDGQHGRLTVRLAYPDAETATEDLFGARFVATWEATPEP